MPTIGEASARAAAERARADLLEQQRIAAWYKAHPERAQALGVLDAELEQKQKEATGEWEARYTGRQRAEIARLNEGKQLIIRSPNFSEAEKVSASKMIDMQIAGISPSSIPKDEQQKQMDAWAAEGKGIGQEWVDEWGNVKTREADGTIKTQVPFEKTRDGIQVKLQAEREKYLGEQRLKLLSETIESTDLAGRTTKSLRYTPVKVEAMLERAFPEYREQQIRKDMERVAAQQVQQEVAQEAAGPWWQQAQQQGLDVQQQDLDLPEEVAQAQAFIRTVNQRYPGGVPGGMKDLGFAYRQAVQVLRQFREPVSMGELESMQRQQGQQQQPEQEEARKHWLLRLLSMMGAAGSPGMPLRRG